MKKKQKDIAELGNDIFHIINCERDIIFKEKALVTVLINFAKIEDDADKKRFSMHILNLKNINSK